MPRPSHVKPDRVNEHATVETALIDTLRHCLPATFDAETESAWLETYALTMQRAAREGAVERPSVRS